MRRTLRLLAAVKPGRFLEAGNPTGLTGLRTHPSPRSYLLYLYNTTLDRLKSFPESSIYRQSTEALTKHRLKIIEDYVPTGLEEWKERALQNVKEHPERFSRAGSKYQITGVGDDVVVQTKGGRKHDLDLTEWNGQRQAPSVEGPRGERAARHRGAQFARAATAPVEIDDDNFEWEPEPQLELSQIGEIEDKIGGGLIEEVIQVAEGELKLIDTMEESRVWEELEEKPLPGQWEYFQRNQHNPK